MGAAIQVAFVLDAVADDGAAEWAQEGASISMAHSKQSKVCVLPSMMTWKA